MNWFRTRVRSGARLALLTLALQMAVSFGHMHRDDLGLPPLGASGHAQATSVATQVAAHRAKQTHHSAPNDCCPICASMALVATAIPSLPPRLEAPEPIHRVWPMDASARGASVEIALSFQARAPPAA